MGFSQAFLPHGAHADEDYLLAEHIEVMIQTVVPGPEISDALPCTRASSIGFGFSMNWALSDGERLEIVRGALRKNLDLFEPRLTSVGSIEVSEDDRGNLVEFSIEGAMRRGQAREQIGVSSKVSFMDQTVKEGAP